MQQLKLFFNDARHFQIVFLFSFLLFGIFYLGWNVEWYKYIALFTACILTQLIGNYFFKLSNQNIKSAIVTSLGLSLLLKTNYWYIALLAGCIAIAAKFIFRYRHRHFVNPANFALVVIVYTTQQAWISPGQWGSMALLILFVGSLGFVVSSKAKSLDIGLSFLCTLFILQFYRSVLYQGWPVDFIEQIFSNGSLLLFTFFMITDPASTPQHKWAKRVWAAFVAGFSFYLSNYKFMNATPIYALFVMQFFSPFFDTVFQYFAQVIAHKKYFSTIPNLQINK